MQQMIKSGNTMVAINNGSTRKIERMTEIPFRSLKLATTLSSSKIQSNIFLLDSPLNAHIVLK